MELFSNEIIVESHCGDSGQGHVFFGRDVFLGIRVVLKQYYISKNLHSLQTEIKVFTLLDQLQCQKNAQTAKRQQVLRGSHLDGLPQLLGYKLNKQHGEIMMTHGGNSLEGWIHHNTNNKEEKLTFAAEMIC